MKIALTTKGKTLSDELDPRFGRAAFFMIYDDVEKSIIKVTDNANILKSGGAGVSSAQEIIAEGVDVLITGALGPNAHNIIGTSGIKVYANDNCRDASDAIEKLSKGELQEILGPHNKNFK